MDGEKILAQKGDKVVTGNISATYGKLMVEITEK